MRTRLLLPALLLPLVLAGVALVVRPAGDGSSRAEQWAEILSGRFTPDATTVEECAEVERRAMYCYAQAFGNIAYRDGGGVAMSRLLAASVGAEGALGDCHSIAHLVGSAAYYGLEKDFAAAIAAGSRECAGGYYHGVLAAESASTPSGTPEELGERLARMCREDIDELGARAECYHGIGHVAEHLYKYETPVALRACDTMRSTILALGADEAEDADAYFSCAQGVFMENRQAEGGPERRWRDADDPTYPCAEFDEEIGVACWDTVPGDVPRPDEMGVVEHTELRFEICATASVESWKSRCNEIARRLVINDETTADEVSEICGFDPAGAALCLRAIASESMIRWSSIERSVAYCDASDDPFDRASCALGIGEGIRYVSLDRSLCDAIAEELIASCLIGYDRMNEQILPVRTED